VTAHTAGFWHVCGTAYPWPLPPEAKFVGLIWWVDPSFLHDRVIGLDEFAAASEERVLLRLSLLQSASRVALPQLVNPSVASPAPVRSSWWLNDRPAC
jgi:hypothetical protein